eukprot:14445867-Alexandrium_andersonii.AAC.1
MRVQINPFNCLTAFSTEPSGCGSCAGGASVAARSPSISAAPAWRSAKAGSLSVSSKALWWCPSLWMLDTAWPTVSSRRRPLRRTRCARIARELRSFNTRTVRDVPDTSFVRTQHSIATSGTVRVPGRTLAHGALGMRPRP